MNYEEIIIKTRESLNKAKENGFEKVITICDTGDMFVIEGNKDEVLEALAADYSKEYNKHDYFSNEWFDEYDFEDAELTELLEDE